MTNPKWMFYPQLSHMPLTVRKRVLARALADKRSNRPAVGGAFVIAIGVFGAIGWRAVAAAYAINGVAWWIGMAAILAFGIVMSEIVVSRMARPLIRDTLATSCPACGYDLTANASGVCPECGRPVGPVVE